MKEKLRKYWPMLLAVFIALVIFLPAAAWGADTAPKETTPEANLLTNIVVVAVSGVVQVLISLFGKLTVQLIHILILVAGYNGYMDSPVITTGWVIVRDVANLFIVALILIVSIGSIVNPERFGGAKQVFRILLYALFINFSRTIAGLFIDISQLIMLTFVNGFAQAAGGNFTEALGVSKLTDVSAGTGVSTGLSFASTMAGLFLALLMFIIITVIIGVMTVALVVRMVTLWLLVVISPLAFALGASDLTKPHYAEWWKKFSAELTTGPIVAFFLWLSLITFQSTDGSNVTGQKLQDLPAGAKEPVSVSCGDTVACSEENMIRFIVATVMLLAGLGFAKDFSGLGGSLAGSALSKGKSYASGAAKWAAKKSWAGAKTVGGVALAPAAIPLAKGADIYNRGKAALGRGLGRASTSDNWAVRNIVGAVTRPASIALTASAGKRNAEKDKAAREKLQYATPEALSGVITNLTTTDAEKRAAAMKIIKDRSFVGARSDATCGADGGAAERGRAAIFTDASDFLRQVPRGHDKDIDDVVKEGSEKRPDAFFDPTSGRTRDEELLRTGDGMDRDKFFKLNLNGINDRDLGTMMSRFSKEVMDAIMKRASGETLRRLNNAILPQGANPAQIDAALASGVNTSNVDLFNPRPAPPPPGTPPTPQTINQNIALETLAHGTLEQIRQLSENPDAAEAAASHAQTVRDHVNWAGAGAASGFQAAPRGERMSDANLRNAEAASLLGASIGDLYKMRGDGNFANLRAARSFEESVAHSPARLSFVLNMGPGQIQNQALRAIYDNVDNNDLQQMSAMARTEKELHTLTALVRNVYNEAGTRGDAARRTAILSNPNLSRLLA